MSLAVCAPSTGDPVVTPANRAETVGRRDLLAGLALAAATTALTVPAAAAVADRSVWDRAAYEYRRLKLRKDAYYSLGPMDWVNERYAIAHMERGSDPEECARAFEAVGEEERVCAQYYGPVDAAALALVRMPAPDLDAVAMKIELHKAHLEGGEHGQVAWHEIEADLKRLAI